MVVHQYRSARRWWRIRCGAAATLAQLALALTEYRGVLADSGLVECPEVLQDDDEDGGGGSDSGASEEGGGGGGGKGRRHKKGGADVEILDSSSSGTEDEGGGGKVRRLGGARRRQGGGKGGSALPARAARSRAAPVVDYSTEDEAEGPSRKRRCATAEDSDASGDGSDGSGEGDTDAEDRVCMVCDSADASGSVMLLCQGCDKAVHTACSQKRFTSSWFCDACLAKPCPQCKRPVRVEDSIVCGPEEDVGGGGGGGGGGRPRRAAAKKKGCDKDFHLACVGLRKAPAGDWYCKTCR
jgi:hypothetical protein